MEQEAAVLLAAFATAGAGFTAFVWWVAGQWTEADWAEALA